MPEPVANSEPHLARAACPRLAPGRELPTLCDRLVDAGVPVAAVPAVEAIVYSTAFEIAGQSVRRLALVLGWQTAGVALRRVILGPEGKSFAEAAAEAGSDKATLARAEARIRRRLRRKMKIGLRSPQ